MVLSCRHDEPEGTHDAEWMRAEHPSPVKEDKEVEMLACPEGGRGIWDVDLPNRIESSGRGKVIEERGGTDTVI
jgi:hypothetical protein